MNNKDAYYFSHDSNARNDQKMLKCRMDLGLEGYAIYFMLIEILRETKTYEITLNYDILSYELRTDKDKIKQVIENYDLFVVDDNILYSKSLKARLELFDSKRLARVEAGRKGGLSNAKAMLKQCSSKKVKYSKVKHSKVKEIKESKEKHLEYVFLTEVELDKLRQKFGTQGTEDRIKNLNEYAHQKHKKFKEYTSHYHTILTWDRNSNQPNTQSVEQATELRDKKRIADKQFQQALQNKASNPDHVKTLIAEARQKAKLNH